jgi:hypothetical protein
MRHLMNVERKTIQRRLPMKELRLTAVMACVLVLAAGWAAGYEGYQETIDKRFPLAAGGTVSLENVNGGIELYADRPSYGESIDLETVNGTLDLYLAASAGAEIRAESVNGKLSNDFGIEVHKGKYVGSDLKGTIGGGGASVSLETVNGSITVHSN